MAVIIRLVSPARGGTSPSDGHYIMAFDPDGHGGRGDLRTTGDPGKAKRFDSPADAREFWRQRSSIQPLRADGKPNRPLTAFTVEVLEVV